MSKYDDIAKELAAEQKPAPEAVGMDLGVTEPVPEAPVKVPLRMVRAPGQTEETPILATTNKYDAIAEELAAEWVDPLIAKARAAVQENEDKTARLGELMKAAGTKDPGARAKVSEIARKTGTPADLVELKLPEFEIFANLAKNDPKKFRELNPALSDLLIQRPDIAPVALQDKQVSVLTKALELANDVGMGDMPTAIKRLIGEDVTLTLSPESSAEVYGKTEAGEPMQPTMGGRKVFRGGKWVEQEARVMSPLAKPGITAEEQARVAPQGRVPQMLYETFAISQKQVEYAQLHAELADRRALAEKTGNPVDTWDLEKKIIDLEPQIGQRFYDANPFEQLGLDAAEILPSEIQSMKGAGTWAVISATIAGGITFAITRNVGLAKKAALRVGAIGSRPGVFYAAQRQEYGAAYAENLKIKTVDGRPVEEPVARGGALLYSIGAALVETGAFPATLKMMGPVGDAIAAGQGKAYVAGLMRKAGGRQMLADIARRWVSGAVAEGKEEGIQAMLQPLALWYRSGGTAEVGTIGEITESAVEQASKAMTGTAVLGAGGAGVNVVTRVAADANARDRAYMAGRQIEVLAHVAETSSTVRAAPDMVAELVRQETEKTGEAVTHVYVDAGAFSRLFQGGMENADQVATELMGEQGPQKLKEALAGAHDGRLEVPVTDYLDKWGGRKIAAALAQDTTVRPGLMTQREQIAQDEQVDARRQALVTEYQKENAPAPESATERRLVEAVGAQLAKTGVYKPADAKKAIAVWRAVIRTQAERTGIDPDTLFADYAATVERENQAARPATALAQEAALKLEAPTQEGQLRERLVGMAPEQREREMFIDPGTGLRNERAWNMDAVDPARPFVAHISVEGVKYANKAGHEVGNALYAAAAHALAGVAPDVAKVKGDFVVRVKDEAELKSILDRANEIMPAKGFALTGSFGPTLEAAQAANIAAKTAAEEAGTRALRGRRPKGLRTRSFTEFLREVWKGPPEDVVGARLEAVQNTIINDTLKAAFREMPEEQVLRAVYYDPDTGFLSREGFMARPKRAHVVSLDLNKLGDINKLFGKPAGNALLKAFADTAKSLGVADFDFAHFSGDEYAAMSDDPVLLQALIDDLGERCDSVGVKMPDGTILKGITFGYGIGADYATADKAIEKHKRRGVGREREARSDRDRRRGDTGRGALGGRVEQAVQRGIREGRPGDLGQKPATAIGPRLAQAAYHGSPHRFSKFTLEHMGEGEGAQAYGYGLYFAGRKDVGEYYRMGLTQNKVSIRGINQADPTYLDRRALEYLADARRQLGGNGDASTVLSKAISIASATENNARKQNADAMADLVRSAIDRMKTLAPEDILLNEGQLYKVDIPGNDELLSYEEAVSEQSQEIQKKLAPIMGEIKRRHAELSEGFEEYRASKQYEGEEGGLGEPITGAHIRSYLESDYNREGPLTASVRGQSRMAREAASKTLLSLGIPGLRYLDQGSRAGGEGTYNYVIWDENAIRDLETFYQVERGYVDRMREGMKKIFKIVLTDKADLSTFLHESGHVFLDVMGDLATKEGANEAIRADYQATLRWLGVKDASEITVEHHEKYARAFETYLREGKAPSVELVSAFQRFKLWLTQIYHALAPGEIDDEIRGVFDRMLATDDEIARMKRAMGAERTFFRTPEEAGMSAAEFQSYLDGREKAFMSATIRTQRRVLSEKIKATRTYLKAERQKALEDAGREYDARPEVVAQAFLRDGQAGENVALQALLAESGEKVGLDRDAVVAEVGDDVTKVAFRGMTEKGGISPDELAEIVGAPDGASLIKAIAAKTEKITWSRERALELLQERSGDVLAEQERLSDEAAKALHDEGNSDWLLKEWQALRKRRGEGAGQAPIESIRLAARDIVDGTSVDALRPGRVLQAERNASDRAFDAVAKQNWKLAAVEKQRQLLNHYIHRETTKALEDREKFERLSNKLADKKHREALGKAGKTFLDAVDTILETLGFSEPVTDPAVLLERQTIPEWMSALEKQGIFPAFDGILLSSILAKERVDPSDISVAEMRMLRSALSQLYATARDLNQVTIEGRRVQINEVIQNIREDTKDLPKQPRAPASDSQATLRYRAKQRWQGVSAALIDPEQMFRNMGVTARRMFWDRYIEQRAVEDELAEKVLKFFLEKWTEMPSELKKQMHALIAKSELARLPFPEDVQRDGALRDRVWMYMLALNTGTRSNLDRLLGGYGWNEEDVRTFLARNMSPEEWAFVQGIWDLMDKELYPVMAKQYESVNGLKPEKIEALPFVLPDGTVIRGGYFPARYDPIASRLGEEQREEALTKLNAGPSAQATLAKSFTKERTKKYTDVINLQWEEVPRHVAQVIHYVAFDSYIRDTSRVLAGMQSVVGERLGAKYYEQMKQWLRIVASPTTELDPAHLRDVNFFLGEARSRFVTSTLGFSLTIAAGDLTNALVAIAAGMTKARFATPALVMGLVKMDEITQKSMELRHRKDTVLANMRKDLSETGRGNRSVFLEGAREAGWWLFALMDRMASAQIWKGAYEQNKSSGMSEVESIREADSVVRRLLPSHDPAEQPAILRDRRGLLALVAFMGYFNKLWNIKREILRPALITWAQADGVAGKIGALPTMAHAAGRVLAVIMVTALIAEFLSGRGPEDDESWGEWALRKALAAPAQDFPIIGQVAEPAINAVIGKILHGEVKERKISIRASPVFALVERVLGSIMKAGSEDRELDDRIWAALEGVGFALKVPLVSNQVGRTGRYITSGNFVEALEEGKPAEAVGGIVYGKRERQPKTPAGVIQNLLEGEAP